MHRFFLPPESFQQSEVTITGGQALQIHAVLHLQPYEVIAVLDNAANEFRVELTSVSYALVRGRVLEKISFSREPRTCIVLYQALLKTDKFEWVLQKGTEIGIAKFIPLVTARGVTHSVSRTKRTRWERIVAEAAEQAGRSKIPPVGAIQDMARVLREGRDSNAISLIPWEEERANDLRAVLSGRNTSTRIHLFIGPEGGFSADEIAQARANGVTPVTLGPRILRAETAGLVAASAILYARGDLDAAAKLNTASSGSSV